MRHWLRCWPMDNGWITADAVFDGAQLRKDLALRVADGRVVETAADVTDAAHLTGTITPGFVDLQVNGGGGVLVNHTPTPEGMAAIAAAHRKLGTVAILPTVITDDLDITEAAATAALTGAAGCIGLHIEGPHISVARRGTHAERFVQPFAARTLQIVERLRAKDVPVMITVAPEAVSPAQIKQLAATGAVVSIGHTDVSADDARIAFAAGAQAVTHLFNAMSPMLNRAPGVVGAAINSDLYAGIICDGQHVADEMVGLAIRARPVPDRMFLVSDAMPTVGGPDRFSLYDMEIHLVDGQLVNDEGSLAGAHVSLGESVARLVHHVGIDLEMALRMAVTVPARVIGEEERLATLNGRRVEDIMVLGPDLSVTGPLSDNVRTSVRA